MNVNAIQNNDWIIENNMDLDVITCKTIDNLPAIVDNTIIDNTMFLDINSKNDEIEKIYVEDLINYNPASMSLVELINTEASIIHFTYTLYDTAISTSNPEVEFTSDTINDIILYLKWISNASLILAQKINQDLIPLNTSDRRTIARSSYNFCKKTQQCKNFYNVEKNPTCRDHHYVHSLVKHDVDSLIQFLSFIKLNDIFLKDNIENIPTTLKTILFVIKHMAKEINFIDNITQNKADLYHINNLLVKKKNIPQINTTRSKNIVQKNNNFSCLNMYSLLDE